MCCAQQPSNIANKRSFVEAFPRAVCGHFHGRAEEVQIPPPPKRFLARRGAGASPCTFVGPSLHLGSKRRVGWLIENPFEAEPLTLSMDVIMRLCDNCTL
ncbi:unnamed protein product [Prunus armeniaca]